MAPCSRTSASRSALKLQFRAEFFNLFNTPQFNVPNRGLNTGGGFLPHAQPTAAITFPSQAGISRAVRERSPVSSRRCATSSSALSCSGNHNPQEAGFRSGLLLPY